MRPTKFGPHIIEAFKAILADDDNVLCGTDDDLFFELNNMLATSQQISYRTFQRYKALALEYGMDDEYIDPDDETNSEYYDPIYQQLYRLFRSAMFRQKKILMRRMIEDEKYWRKWQWILERKFREWNLRWSSMEAERTQKKDAIEEDKMVVDNDEPPEVRLVYTPRPTPPHNQAGASDTPDNQADTACDDAAEPPEPL
jgi:hypothetical protein